MKFKVQYTPTPIIIDLDIPIEPIGVDMVMIKIKNEELNLEETLETENGGVVASEQKYAFGTKFTVEVTKVGWELLTNVDEGITVTADEKEITYELKRKQFKLSFNVVDKAGAASLSNVKIKISDGFIKMEELMSGANGKAETKKQYDFGTKLTIFEVSKDGYKLETDLANGITVGAEEADNVVKIVMSIELVCITKYIFQTTYYVFPCVFFFSVQS